MYMLETWWPVLVVVLLIGLVVRRIRGEPLDLKDALASPAIFLLIGGRTIVEAHPTTVDVLWLIGLSIVGLGFGAARAGTTIIERRGETYFQRYRWKTFAWLVGSLIVGGGLGLLAQQLGMHEEARPLTFTLGVGLAGESAITLLRAARRGVPMPRSSTPATYEDYQRTLGNP